MDEVELLTNEFQTSSLPEVAIKSEPAESIEKLLEESQHSPFVIKLIHEFEKILNESGISSLVSEIEQLRIESDTDLAEASRLLHKLQWFELITDRYWIPMLKYTNMLWKSVLKAYLTYDYIFGSSTFYVIRSTSNLRMKLEKKILAYLKTRDARKLMAKRAFLRIIQKTAKRMLDQARFYEKAGMPEEAEKIRQLAKQNLELKLSDIPEGPDISLPVEVTTMPLVESTNPAEIAQHIGDTYPENIIKINLLALQKTIDKDPSREWPGVKLRSVQRVRPKASMQYMRYFPKKKEEDKQEDG